MKQYPTVLRERLLRCVDAGHSQAEAARIFGVSVRTVSRWRAQQQATGELAPRVRPGRTPRIGPAQAALLQAQVVAAPDATLAEHCATWAQQHHVTVSVATMCRAIRRLGITVKKSPLRPGAR